MTTDAKATEARLGKLADQLNDLASETDDPINAVANVCGYVFGCISRRRCNSIEARTAIVGALAMIQHEIANGAKDLR